MEEKTPASCEETNKAPEKESNHFLQRILTAAFIVVSVGSAFVLRQVFIETVGRKLFDIMLLCFAVVGTIEMVLAFRDKMTWFEKIVVLVFSVGYVPACAFFGITRGVMMLFAAVAMLIADCVFSFDKKSVEGLGASVLTLFYPTVFLTGMLYLNAKGYFSFPALLLLFVVSSFSDSGAMLVGVAIKGKKLYPKISPKKTISGAIGGLLGGLVGALVVWAFLRGMITDNVGAEIAIYAIAGVLGSVATQFGDLAEGALKRKIGIKDFGKILPGHGGMLDRIDGLLFNSFFIALYFTAIAAIVL